MALGWIFYKFQHSNSVARKMIKHHKPTKVEECRTSERSWTNDAHIFKNKKKLLKFKYNLPSLVKKFDLCFFFMTFFLSMRNVWAFEVSHLFRACFKTIGLLWCFDKKNIQSPLWLVSTGLYTTFDHMNRIFSSFYKLCDILNVGNRFLK